MLSENKITPFWNYCFSFRKFTEIDILFACFSFYLWWAKFQKTNYSSGGQMWVEVSTAAFKQKTFDVSLGERSFWKVVETSTMINLQTYTSSLYHTIKVNERTIDIRTSLFQTILHNFEDFIDDITFRHSFEFLHSTETIKILYSKELSKCILLIN